MQVNIWQIKIKYQTDYLFNDNMIVNIKHFDSSLLEINKVSFKGIFSLNNYYIKYISRKSLNHLSISRTRNDEYFLFLDDVDGHVEKKNGIKYVVFTPKEKKQRSIKKLQRTLRRN